MIVTCPDRRFSRDIGIRSIFLAGGITGCPDWQSVVSRELDAEGQVILNPRRDEFDVNDPSVEHEQIRWEFDMLRQAGAILFWFPATSICPIALYELGAWNMTDKPLFIGTDSAYPRRSDVVIQTRLVRQDVIVYDSLDDTVRAALAWMKSLTNDAP